MYYLELTPRSYELPTSRCNKLNKHLIQCIRDWYIQVVYRLLINTRFDQEISYKKRKPHNTFDTVELITPDALCYHLGGFDWVSILFNGPWLLEKSHSSFFFLLFRGYSPPSPAYLAQDKNGGMLQDWRTQWRRDEFPWTTCDHVHGSSLDVPFILD
jgi:hypothetical protein